MSEQLKQDGLDLFRRGAYEQACAKFEAAEASFKESGDPVNQGEMLNNLGVVYRYMRRPRESEAAFLQAKTLFARLQDRHREGQVLGNMGDLYETMGERNKAGGYYLEAIEVFEAAQDHDKLAQTLRVMSLMRLRQLRIVEAMAFTRRRLKIKPRPNLLDRFAVFILTGWLKRIGALPAE